MTINSDSLAQKRAECSMAVWSLTYLYLFIVLSFVFGSSFGSDLGRQNAMGQFLGLVALSPIFIILPSLGLMWFSYLKGYYRITRICWMIPIFFFALAIVILVTARSKGMM
jgi:hypothetical protein